MHTPSLSRYSFEPPMPLVQGSYNQPRVVCASRSSSKEYPCKCDYILSSHHKVALRENDLAMEVVGMCCCPLSGVWRNNLMFPWH